VVFLVAASAAHVPSAWPSGVDAVPCNDPRGCPDLVVDALQLLDAYQRRHHFPAGHCAVQEGMVEAGNRTLLRFAFNTPNVGEGDLIIGHPAAHPEWFVWHACHAHYHFLEYADYRLWTLNGYELWRALRDQHPERTAAELLADHPHLLHHFVSSDKRGFCTIDVYPALPTRHGVAVPADLPKYTSCMSNQGISRGWADHYANSIDGQWIDVTHVLHGPYWLEVEVNAERLFIEAAYANNWEALPVFIGATLPF
jgi:hypothetical protein